MVWEKCIHHMKISCEKATKQNLPNVLSLFVLMGFFSVVFTLASYDIRSSLFWLVWDFAQWGLNYCAVRVMLTVLGHSVCPMGYIIIITGAFSEGPDLLHIGFRGRIGAAACAVMLALLFTLSAVGREQVGKSWLSYPACMMSGVFYAAVLAVFCTCGIHLYPRIKLQPFFPWQRVWGRARGKQHEGVKEPAGSWNWRQCWSVLVGSWWYFGIKLLLVSEALNAI